MNFFTRDFFTAASKASKTTVKVKKNGEVETFSFQKTDSKNELKKELATAEKLFKKLKSAVSKEKLSMIKDRMEMLRTSLEGEKITAPDTVIHHEDMVIHPPIFEDLQNELEEFDKLFDVPKKDEAPKEEPVTEIKEEIELPERPKGILNIPPPPKKDSA